MIYLSFYLLVSAFEVKSENTLSKVLFFPFFINPAEAAYVDHCFGKMKTLESFIPGFSITEFTFSFKRMFLILSRAADSIYAEEKIETGYASKIEDVCYGIKISLYRVSIKTMYETLKPGISIGIVWESLLKLSIYFENINLLFTEDNTLTSTRIIEFSFQPVNSATVVSGFEYSDELRSYIYTGYTFGKEFGLLVGAKTNPVTVNVKISLNIKKKGIEFLSNYNPELGISKGIQVCFLF